MLTTKVESSNLAEVGWENENLYVTFKRGGKGYYPGVPLEKYNELVEAQSCGKYLAAHIKPNYAYHSLDALNVA